MGSKDSGYRAWAQNMHSRVVVDLWHNKHFERDFCDIEIDASTQNYGGPGRIRLASGVDIDALLKASVTDPKTAKYLNAAIQSIQKANDAAVAFQQKADKLREKATA